ncbi:hypothetical protein [Leifsonia sp. Leaf264]|uniref:hypothetical protein n=1 Tax=Leifsonia sp. Leaf264 TaxID=1736314 RepID=UPI0006F3EA31|nr:hypothetical protein [Leifsonia sp. Leaf264]KQO95418.1 hypothetical protein ASF30_20595 [Leifsonia sp. Leaf264]
MATRNKAVQRSPKSAGTSIWVILGITAFVFADFVLIGLAVIGQHAPVPTAPPVVPSTSETASPEPTPSPTAAAPRPVAAPALRFLDATSTTSAWRATPGDCTGTPAAIESTTDAGATWVSYSTGDIDIREVLALTAVSDTTAFVVAKAGPDCTLGYFRTFSTGDQWQEAPADLASQSYVDPTDRALVVIDGESLQSPCPSVRQLVVDGDSRIAICDDAAYSLDSTTGEWAGLERPNLASIAASGTAATVIESGDTECPALAFATTDAASLDQPAAVTCAPGAVVPASLASDQVDEALWLWQGDSAAVVPLG